MKEELWVPIIITKNGELFDYTGYYEISNFGQVRSLDRVVTDWRGEVLLKGKIKNSVSDADGYLVVSLHKEGKTSMFKIHRLVATAFIPNPENLPQVNHKDENKQNNKVDNLEWCTAKYNRNFGTCIERGRNTSLKNDSYNKSRDKAKRTLIERGSYGAPKPILKINPLTGEVIKEYASATLASAEHGNNSHISDAALGKRNIAAGYKWIYKEDYNGE